MTTFYLGSTFPYIDELLSNNTTHKSQNYFYEYDKENNFKLVCKLPGFKKEDIELKLTNDGYIKIKTKSKNIFNESFNYKQKLLNKSNKESIKVNLENGLLSVFVKNDSEKLDEEIIKF